jgi:hypothetical protein
VNDPGVSEAGNEFTPDVFNDTYLNIELAVPRDSDGTEFARVTKRLRDKDGLPIGNMNNNPILDTRMYEMEYPDRRKASFPANAIAENMFAQAGDEGSQHILLLEERLDHGTNRTEVKQQDAFLTTRNGDQRQRKTTKGWKIIIQ